MEIEIAESTYQNSIIGRALFKLANKIGDKKTILQVKAERKMIQTVNDNYYKQQTIIEQQLEIQQKDQELEQNKQEQTKTNIQHHFNNVSYQSQSQYYSGYS